MTAIPSRRMLKRVESRLLARAAQIGTRAFAATDTTNPRPDCGSAGGTAAPFQEPSAAATVAAPADAPAL